MSQVVLSRGEWQAAPVILKMTPNDLRRILEREQRHTRIVVVCCIATVLALWLTAWSVL